MFYEITGGTKHERKLAETALLFAKQYLMPRIRDLDIEISIEKDMTADADVVGDEREYEMRIRKGQDDEDLITAIFHEMVHVKQYARKELTVNHAWKGVPIDQETEYWDLPWEIEAHGREVGLFIRWAQTHGHAEKKWAQDPL